MLKAIFRVYHTFKLTGGATVMVGYPEPTKNVYVFEGSKTEGDHLRFYRFETGTRKFTDKMKQKAFGRGDQFHIAGMRQIISIDVAPRRSQDAPPAICVFIDINNDEFEKIIRPNKENIEGKIFEIHGI